MSAGIALVLVSCGSGPEPEPPSSTTGSTVTTARTVEPDVIPTDLSSPVLRGDLLVQPPAPYEPADGGFYVDLRAAGKLRPLFDITAIPGDFVPVLSSWEMTDHGTAALLYVTQYPDEGLKPGAAEVGVLVRQLGSGEKESDQVKTALVTVDPSVAEEMRRHPSLVKVYRAVDRLVVIDFLTRDYWIIGSSGEPTKHRLSRDVITDDCLSYEKSQAFQVGDIDTCLDDRILNDLQVGTLTSVEADPDRLVLVNMNSPSGALQLLSIDLGSGDVAGPRSWPNAIFGSDGVVTCHGLEFCVAAMPSKRREDGVQVMNRFNPITLRQELVPVPESLVDFGSVMVLGSGLLLVGSSTAFTDLTGTQVIWRLGDNVRVHGSIPTDSVDVKDATLLATNANGEMFFVDPATGEQRAPLVTKPEQLRSFDHILGTNRDWVVGLKGRAIARVPR